MVNQVSLFCKVFIERHYSMIKTSSIGLNKEYLFRVFCEFEAARNVFATLSLILHVPTHARRTEGALPDICDVV